MKLRILWLSHFLPFPKQGHGALQRSGNLLRFLNDHAHVKLLAIENMVVFGNRELYKRELECEFFRPEFFADSVGLNRFKKSLATLGPILGDSPYSTAIYHSAQMEKRATELTDSGDFDIVHVDTMGLGTELIHKRQCRIVLNHHNVESEMMKLRAERSQNAILKRYFRREAATLRDAEQKNCILADQNIVVSDADSLLLKSIVSDCNTTVIPNCVDETFFSNEKSFDERRGAMFAGGTNWYPNKDAILYMINSIWPKLIVNEPKIQLTLVGIGTESFTNKTTRIDGTGAVDDIRSYFSAARVFVCPMRQGGGTRLKLLDAMAAGVPIVTTTIGAEGLNLVHGEHALVADDPNSFADSIIKLHSDRILWEKLSSAGKDYVHTNYSIKIVGRKLIEVYAKVAETMR